MLVGGSRRLFCCWAAVPVRERCPLCPGPSLVGDGAPAPCTRVPRDSCGVGRASSQRRPRGADGNVVVVCVPRWLCRGLPCVSWGTCGEAAPTLGESKGRCLRGAASCPSCQARAGVLPQPPWTCCLLPARHRSPAPPQVALQGTGRPWPLLPVGGRRPQLLCAPPSETSPAPGAGGSCGTSAASS